MSLTLSPEFSARVLARSAEAGTTPEELLEEALAVWETGELLPLEPDELNAQIQKGLAAIQRGEVVPGAEVMAKAQRLLDQYLRP